MKVGCWASAAPGESRPDNNKNNPRQERPRTGGRERNSPRRKGNDHATLRDIGHGECALAVPFNTRWPAQPARAEIMHTVPNCQTSTIKLPSGGQKKRKPNLPIAAADSPQRAAVRWVVRGARRE